MGEEEVLKPGGIILAAGGSRRLGRAKQLLMYEGQTLLNRIVSTFSALPLQDLCLVYGARQLELAAALDDLGVNKVHNPNWETGMSSSLQLGLGALLERNSDLQSVLISLVDQPLITKAHFEEMIRLHQQHPGAIIAAAYDEVWGVPVIFPQAFFEELLSQNGRVGAKKILKKYASQVIPFFCPAAAFDIDTEADYQRLLSS